jgi:hypothetical protein
MTDFDKEEFWKALGRLYDSSRATADAAERLLKITRSHEKRLDKLEVVVQWLSEEQRKRDRA